MSKAFVFSWLRVFFKHTNDHGFLHPYNYLEWTSYVREAYFQETVPNFLEVLNRPIKMMTVKITSELIEESCFGDCFEARLTVDKIKKVSFDMIVRFYNLRKQQVTCITRHSIVFVDTRSNKFAPIPDEMFQVIVLYLESPESVGSSQQEK